MKRFLVPVIISVLIGCSSSQETDKKAELEKLKGQQAELSRKIDALEKEIASEGGQAATGVTKMVAVSTVAPQPFSHYVEVQGKIDGDENVSVSPKSPGTISRVLVKVGDRVSRGQVLAEMDNQVMAQTIEELKTSLAFATNVYEKQKKLWEQKIGTEIQFLTARNNKESLERKLSTVKEQMDLAIIRSPINGTVDAVDIKIGQAAAPGMPAFRVVNFSKLKVVAEISESYASKVKVGNPVKISFPDIGKEIDEKLDFVAGVINALNRTFTVEASLPEAGSELKPNMIAVLKINDYRNDSAVVVPVNMIQNSEDGNYVFVVKETSKGKFAEKRSVVPGKTYNGVTEIEEGLSQGDKLITQGYNEISNGQPITF